MVCKLFADSIAQVCSPIHTYTRIWFANHSRAVRKPFGALLYTRLLQSLVRDSAHLCIHALRQLSSNGRKEWRAILRMQAVILKDTTIMMIMITLTIVIKSLYAYNKFFYNFLDVFFFCMLLLKLFYKIRCILCHF